VAVYLSGLAGIVETGRRLKVLADNTDNRVFECAVAGRFDLIATGEKAMRQLREYRGIRIISLRDVLATLR
jgi:predicted nucleic acid-binding protein